ncbi:dihydroorotate oxidase A [Solimonas aquatica]|uniref:Dihydroorotate dehydrogenase (quinone) n=1 Tax=Solimonas aquatica TaxID=489703 RepID=A0A1H9KJC2_9GAMM|nr:quinone-dependent dihydroorotate dehydrogenase [Solimonas aquatica]SEQ99198.1 dihydroorotate oxidase A [Solimonas aquatica]
MYAAARSLLFRLDAEHAHELTLDLFRRLPRLATLPFAHGHVQDPVELLGLRFANRVGLAAGLDKNGECLAAWSRLGFGFVEIGTVTPRPQPGNPRPRMFRLPREQALINRLGFNNKGVDYLLQRVAENAQNPQGFRGVLGINIGKNFDTPIERAAEDYLICLRKVYRAASYVTVNISSPNTKNLRELQGEAQLRELLQLIKHEAVGLAREHGKRTPILVKIAPDVSEEQLDAIARVVRESGIDGLIATNTTISRPLPADEPLAAETGGLSGAPLRPLAQATLQGLRQRLGPDFPLIGVGGIDAAQAARERAAAGAQLIQVYTGFIYRGPMLVRECAEALKQQALG